MHVLFTVEGPMVDEPFDSMGYPLEIKTLSQVPTEVISPSILFSVFLVVLTISVEPRMLL